MAYNGNNLSALYTFTTTGSWQQWVYRSADAIATVTAAGYITDAADRGLALGDIVWVTETVGNATSICRVTAVSAAGVANLSTGVVVT
jgi:anaerobic selenocysteine-containing dehydrogenase